MSTAVAGSCLVLAWLSFAAFLYITLEQLNAKGKAASAAQSTIANPKAEGVADIDIPKLLDNLTKLIDSLTKAGPGLAALGASILFLALATFGAEVARKATDPSAPSAANDAAKPVAPTKKD